MSDREVQRLEDLLLEKLREFKDLKEQELDGHRALTNILRVSEIFPIFTHNNQHLLLLLHQ